MQVLSLKERKTILEFLDSHYSILTFFDDDQDGLISFTIFKKNSQSIDEFHAIKGFVDWHHVKKIQNSNPDAILILDKPVVKNSFFEKTPLKDIMWIDHHPPNREVPNFVKYINPRLRDANAYVPTSLISYKVFNNKSNLWHATLGCLADFFKPSFFKTFLRQNSFLSLSENDDLPYIIYESEIAETIRLLKYIMFFKSKTSKKLIQSFLNVPDFETLYFAKSEDAKILWDKTRSYELQYRELLSTKPSRKGHVLTYFLTTSLPFTSSLSSHLAYKNQDKIVIVARKNKTNYVCSIRAFNFRVDLILDRVKKHLNIVGGGHERACGAIVPENKMSEFIELFSNYSKDFQF